MDVVRAFSRLDIDTEFHGGSGNDFLFGSSRGQNILVGDEGNDFLLGGRNRDVLVGGVGIDLLLGLGEDDLLIGGSTSFDDDSTTLRAIAAEWNSERDYLTCIANLSGTRSGLDFDNRGNGPSFLISEGPDATVQDDGENDRMFGVSGANWFFADLTGGTDTLVGRRDDEVVDEFA